MKPIKPMKPEDIYFRLSELRLKHDVSGRDMSLTLGQNVSYINNIEGGKAYPSMLLFFSICSYLNITPQDFFELNNHDPERINSMTEILKTLNNDQLIYLEALLRDITKS